MVQRCFFLLLLFTTAPAVWARLGDTEAELTKRLGPPTSQGRVVHSFEGRSLEIGRRLFFRQDDWSIQCDIIDERCARASYGKTGRWSDEQILAVLTTNAQGMHWQEITKPPEKGFQRKWKRADGALASWSTMGGMSVVHPAFERAQATAEAKLKAQSRKVPKL